MPYFFDIRRETSTGLSTEPTYRLSFLRYDSKFVGGAQHPVAITGSAPLEAYLIKLRFDAEAAMHWIRKIDQNNGSVSITNVIMPVKLLRGYTTSK